MHSFHHALARQPSPGFAAYYSQKAIAISDVLALGQHTAYVAALAWAGLKVSVVPPHLTRHDCIFIEDTAIVFGGRALITRMNDVREGEQRDVAEWLASKGLQLEHCPPEARIEGGDVLHLDDLTLVGRSARTNDAGI